MSGKGQSSRLTDQHIESHGVIGIFGKEAKYHDSETYKISTIVLKKLHEEFPKLNFRLRKNVYKTEINDALQKIDPDLGKTLILDNPSLSPDGGVIEVCDDNGQWRILTISEAKYQGKDIDNIKAGKKVGKNKDQDLMAAGNAIERSYKNIREFANLMLTEKHFPYILFLEGTNFLTQDVTVTRPDGTELVLKYNSGILN